MIESNCSESQIAFMTTPILQLSTRISFVAGLLNYCLHKHAQLLCDNTLAFDGKKNLREFAGR